MEIFNPLQNRHPSINCQKLVIGDYVASRYCCAKFCANLSMGLHGKWVKYNLIFLLIYYLGTHLEVRPLDGFLCLMAETMWIHARICCFGVLLILFPI